MPPPEDDATRSQLVARVPRHLRRAVKLAALTEDVPVSEWVADALAAHLRRCRGPRPVEPPSRESA